LASGESATLHALNFVVAGRGTPKDVLILEKKNQSCLSLIFCPKTNGAIHLRLCEKLIETLLVFSNHGRGFNLTMLYSTLVSIKKVLQ
jgi:hypothetical protein